MAIKSNLVIDQGTTFSTIVTLVDSENSSIDVTGYTVSSQIRKHYSSSNSQSFSTSLGGANGTVTLSLTSTQTSSLVAGRYVYDIEITSPSGTVTRIVEGIVTVTPEVSRGQSDSNVVTRLDRLDELEDVVEVAPANGHTLVYRSTDDKYVVQQLSFDYVTGTVDGGSF
jgi:hypothetical protein